MIHQNTDNIPTPETQSAQPEHPLNQANVVSAPSTGGIKNHWVKIICVILLAALFFILSRYEHRIHDRNVALATPAVQPTPFSTDSNTAKTGPTATKTSHSQQATNTAAETNQPTVKATPSASTTEKTTPKTLVQQPATKTKAPVTPIIPNGPYHWQLMASMNAQVIQSKLQQQAYIDQQAYILTKLIHGKQWYTLNIGHYPNKEAAKQAWSTMPARLQSHKPWLRKSP